MIDPRLLRQEFAKTTELLATRGLPSNIGDWPKLDSRRRELIGEVEAIRGNKNKLGPEIAKAKKEGKDVSDLFAQLKTSGEREEQINSELAQIETDLLAIEQVIPNVPDSSVPVGTSSDDNRIEKTWGSPRQFDFEPKPHWDIGEGLGILNFEQARKLSGARFAVYRGDGARLERALINFMLEHHRQRGYTEIIPPLLVREETMVGSGQLPKFRAEAFKTAEFDPQLFLVPTSEVALCNLHADEILEEGELPIYYTSYTPCFRAEAGSHGRDVRGLIRLHQFNKVELVKFTRPEASYDELERLTEDAEEILKRLGLHYRERRGHRELARLRREPQ